MTTPEQDDAFDALVEETERQGLYPPPLMGKYRSGPYRSMCGVYMDAGGRPGELVWDLGWVHYAHIVRAGVQTPTHDRSIVKPLSSGDVIWWVMSLGDADEYAKLTPQMGTRVHYLPVRSGHGNQADSS